jgi:AcrR family transcriptional regulator
MLRAVVTARRSAAPTPRNSAATKQRLLEAASEEFSAHGIAGARVDRIAAAAQANKQLIYAYFGSKDGLFDAALTDSCTAMIDAVPFEAEDIPGYVGRLFDYAVEHPEIFRLVTWAGLERPTAVADVEAASYGAKLKAIAGAQRTAKLDAGLAPADLLALVMAIAAAWFSASEAIRTFDSKDPWSRKRLAQFRSAAVEAAARVLRP